MKVVLNNNYALYFIAITLITFSITGCNSKPKTTEEEHPGQEQKNDVAVTDTLRYDQEIHLTNVRQLTFGGDNAEAYWSFDNSKLVFQSNYTQWDVGCDQIFITDPFSDNMKSTKPKMISTGKGRTTCAYFMPGDETVVYASTHLGGEACPPVPERRTDGKYLWPVYNDYDIFVTNLEGEIVKQLTNSAGYDAEATVSPLGDKIVFTSTRSGDLELFTMNIDGSDIVQVTDGLGYDGGAFFSPDGKQLVFRASRPKTEEEIKEYKNFLEQGLVAPTAMEIYTCNVDGSNLKQITHLGKANWAPFFHPSGDKIIFSSNHKGKRGFEFNLFMIDTNGENLEQITYDGVFDAFPMFSPDGKQIVFSSNRNNKGTRDTNLFVADWVE